MDAYAEILRAQSEARLCELRREAAHYRLIRSVSQQRRSLRALAGALVRRDRRSPVEEAAVTVLRPLSSPVLAADDEAAVAQRRAS
jgi:hypothetical protein